MSRATGFSHALRLTALTGALGACLSTPSLRPLASDGDAAGIDGRGADSGGVDGNVEGPGIDGAADDDANAIPDSSVACPAACSGGCGGGICVIRGVGGSTCPPGLSCQVKCENSKSCERTITCAVGKPCIVECTATKACDSVRVDQNGASSLCLRCSNGDQACNSVTCSASSCVKVCNPENACNSACGNCATATACP